MAYSSNSFRGGGGGGGGGRGGYGDGATFTSQQSMAASYTGNASAQSILMSNCPVTIVYQKASPPMPQATHGPSPAPSSSAPTRASSSYEMHQNGGESVTRPVLRPVSVRIMNMLKPDDVMDELFQGEAVTHMEMLTIMKKQLKETDGEVMKHIVHGILYRRGKYELDTFISILEGSEAHAIRKLGTDLRTAFEEKFPGWVEQQRQKQRASEEEGVAQSVPVSGGDGVKHAMDIDGQANSNPDQSGGVDGSGPGSGDPSAGVHQAPAESAAAVSPSPDNSAATAAAAPAGKDRLLVNSNAVVA